MKVRVMHVVPTFSLGGAERMAMHLLTNLDRTRFDPMSVSLYPRRNTDIETMLDQSGVPTKYLRKEPGLDIRLYTQIQRVVAEFDPHVIHTHLYALRYMLPTLLKRASRTVALHTVHNMASREAKSFDRKIYWPFYRTRMVTPVAIAKSVQKSILDEYRLDCPVVPLGIPVGRYRAALPDRERLRREYGVTDEELLLVNVGRLFEQKNHILLLEVMRALVTRVPQSRLWIVGEGVLLSDLRRKTVALDIAAKVEFLGSRSDIPEILAAADVAVSSSAWEGTPLWIMEAMAAGKPVVATEVGGVPEVVSNGVTGILTSPNDSVAMSDAIFRLWSEPALRLQMSTAAARDATERFSVEAMTRSYECLYLERLRLDSEIVDQGARKMEAIL